MNDPSPPTLPLAVRKIVISQTRLDKGDPIPVRPYIYQTTRLQEIAVEWEMDVADVMRIAFDLLIQQAETVKKKSKE